MHYATMGMSLDDVLQDARKVAIEYKNHAFG